MRMLIAGLVAIAVIVGGLAAYSASRTARLSELHPPAGNFTRVDGLRMHYVQLGHRRAAPVVLLHGASGNLNDPMMALGERLAETKRVIAIDRPGHGWSERADGPQSALPSDQARYVIGVLDNLKIDRAVIVGHSWSGALALSLALDHPDRVAGLMLLAPASHPWPGGVRWYYTLASLPALGHLFTQTLVLPFGELMVRPAVRRSFAPQEPPSGYLPNSGAALVLRPPDFRANATDMARLLDFLADQAPRYAELSVPTVIITGNADKTVAPRIHSRPLAGQIAGARLIEFDGVGHMPHHADPDRVVAEIKQLAAELDPPIGGKGPKTAGTDETTVQ